MLASEVLALLDLCDAAGLEVTLDGGWAVDAALGRQTRAHGDLDLALPADQLARLEELLGQQGFARVPTADGWACNYVLGHADGRRVDLHGYRLNADGSSAGGVPYIADHLTGSGRIDGRPVRIVPPRWLVAFRSGYAMDAEDVADVTALCRQFGLTPTPDLVATARRLGIPLDLTPETGIETRKE